jgi:ubiquitin C-terminal hydrolase
MEGGHYTAYCYSSSARQWFKYDDHDVNEMNARDVMTSAAYVLFYTTKNMNT